MRQVSDNERVPERSSALDRGLALLAVLAESPAPLSVSELAQRMELSRPVIYRLVTTLLDHGYARREADSRISIGPGVLRLSQRAQPQLRRLAMPVLRELAEATGATAHLSVADGEEAVALAVVEPGHTDFHVAYRVGSRHSLHSGAAGRAILQHRAGDDRPVRSAGELQPGAHGLAVALPSDRVEASVGLVAFGPLEENAAEPLQRAASALAAALG